MKLVLIGNYLPDKQESMLRFAQMLDTGFRAVGHQSEIWAPTVLFGKKTKNAHVGIGKWLGYLDKWVVFPAVLRWRLLRNRALRTNVRFHICDHSNSPYLAHLPVDQASISCHDVLAIRGGLGYADAHVPASRLGVLLQRWILSNLRRARRLAAVSQFTLDQLHELVAPGTAEQKNWRVIHNAFNATFKPIDAAQAKTLAELAGVDTTRPFILHVGSELPRKNRRLLLDMVAVLGARWQGTICLAGDAPDAALLAHAEALGLLGRIISVVKPDHDTLVALYNACEAFIFPSYSEGFGWPVIEAQACGTPVIASSVAPMPEVSGGAALHADPTDAAAFAEAFLSLANKETRAELVQKGLVNCQRFELHHMLAAYLAL